MSHPSLHAHCATAVPLLLCALVLLVPPGSGLAAPGVAVRMHVARELPVPLKGHPGQVFVRGEEVAVDVPDAEGATGWACLDYGLTVVASGEGRRADLGRLPVGFYELWATSAAKTRLAKTTLAVLAALSSPTPEDSPICLDAAMSWFCTGLYGYPPNVDGAASLAALAGANWVRDRLTWQDHEPERGVFVPSALYDGSVALQAAAGLTVLDVIHESPAWANPVSTKRLPHDLRDVYRYFASMSSRWRGQVLAWEPWNEADIEDFGGHTGSEIASYQKAAYWGLVAGNPEVVVCQSCFAYFAEGTAANWAENEPWPYMHTMNFHHYIGADEFPAFYSRVRSRSGGRPLWVTEAGIRMHWEGGDPDEPPWEWEQRQARFVPQCLAASIHEGSEATFYFLLPYLADGRAQYGLTHKDLTPRPGYVALAAAGRLLAGAKPLGRIETKQSPTLRAFAFSARPDGERKTVVVAWATEGTPTLALPDGVTTEAAFDLLGRPVEAPSKSAELGIDPVYLILAEGAKDELPLTPPPGSAEWVEGQPCPLVLQALLPAERVRLNPSAYGLPDGEELAVPVYVYNFGEEEVATDLIADGGASLHIDPPSVRIAVEPNGRTEALFRIRLAGGTVSPLSAPAGFVADCGAQGRAVLVMRFVPPLGQVAPAETLKLTCADSAGNWQALHSPGTMTIEDAEGGGVLVDAALEPGDRWVYPILSPPENELPKADWDGLAFTIVPLMALAGGDADFKVMLTEAGGSSYLASAGLGQGLEADGPVRAAVLLSSLQWGAFSPPDANSKLDLADVVGLSIGCNTSQGHVSFVIRDLAWAKYAE